jgi:NAD(P)H-hydrate epimerase
MKILTASVLREWEAREIASGRVHETELMRVAVAGGAAFLRQWPDAPRRLLVLAGKGHNGNDGLLLASVLRADGWEVEVVLSHPPDQRRSIGIPEVAAEAAAARVWPDIPAPTGRWTVVDALLGSGGDGAPRGATADMLAWADRFLHASGSVGVALDVPTGLGSAGPVFTAAVTLAIGAVKPECLRDASIHHVGRLVPVALPLRDAPPGGEFITPLDAAAWVRPLPAGLHKYRRGEVSVWAGSPGMAGAAALASRAALRAGAGIVRLWTHPDVVATLAVATPEVMVASVADDGPLPPALVGSSVLLAGPGVGRTEASARLLRRLGEETRAALVLDADALVLAAADPALLRAAGARTWVATPHTGELARFLDEPVVERAEALRILCARHPQGVWVAKGPRTLVADADTITWNGTGNPGMATAGMGDVLGGIIAALLGQGLSASVAARLGVCWHGAAADAAACAGAEATLTAGDVIEHLPTAWARFQELGRGGFNAP